MTDPTPKPPSAEELAERSCEDWIDGEKSVSETLVDEMLACASALVAALDRLTERKCDGRSYIHMMSDGLLHDHECARLHGHAGGCHWRKVPKP